ncbi:hypothetical protein MPSEU_000558900 [Mayamaea pseudoterrestris]|nr:hypothetical protein MPSEU_000558900 [Mayamaea pseudoterrestris]
MEPIPTTCDYYTSPEWFAIHDQTTVLQTDQLVALLKVERVYSIPHIPCRSSQPRQEKPLQHWRRKICQWSFRVIDHFLLDREVVSVGMHLLDRFLAACSIQQQSSSGTKSSAASPCACPSCKRCVDSEFYQLAAMTCIYLAVKLHIDNGSDADAAHRRTFKLQAFCELSRGLFRKDHVIHMEQTILRALNWKVVNTPTPMTFVNYYLAVLMPEWELRRDRHELVVHVLRELSRYLTELVVCLEEECTQYPPSQIGFAALLVAMDLLTLEALPARVRSSFCHRVDGLCCWDDEQATYQLQATLGTSLWPEMLLDDCVDADASHPITLARDYGILNMFGTSRARAVTPPKQDNQQDVYWKASPVSVTQNLFCQTHRRFP